MKGILIKMKKNNGMGILQLIVMIVFIILIVTTSVYFVSMKYHEVRVETIKTDMLQVQWKMKDYIDKQTVSGEEKKYLGTPMAQMKDDVIIQKLLSLNVLDENEYDKYYVLKDEELGMAGLEITNYRESYFLINYETYEIIVTKGCKYFRDETLYKLSDIINKLSIENNEEVNQ